MRQVSYLFLSRYLIKLFKKNCNIKMELPVKVKLITYNEMDILGVLNL